MLYKPALSVSANQFVCTAVNTKKQTAEKNANELPSCNLNGAYWRSKTGLVIIFGFITFGYHHHKSFISHKPYQP